MHKNLKGEIVKSKYTIKSLAKEIGIAEKSLRNKINGKTQFTLPEAIAIKNFVNREMSLEDLFATEQPVTEQP